MRGPSTVTTMPTNRSIVVCLAALCLSVIVAGTVAEGARVTVDLSDARGVTLIGAFDRWDKDGNLRRPINAKARIDSPEVDHTATRGAAGRWVFENLPPGKYDLVIMAAGKVRIEGWRYAPVLEFDPFIPPQATIDEETREFITQDIKKSRHYENKVVPLCMGMGDDKKVARVLVMLIRDKATSYEGHMPRAATIRHEIWQYMWQYGGWRKEKRTKVIDRGILTREELRHWTWLWDPKLGGIEVNKSPITVEYQMPGASDKRRLKGLYPY